MRTPTLAIAGLALFATAALAQAPVPPLPPAQAPLPPVPPGPAAPAPARAPEAPVVPPPPVPDPNAAAAAAIERFKQAYAKRGAPRIAVFWNRQLSDRLSQWVATDRVVATDNVAVMREGGRNDGEKLAASGERVVSAQKLDRDAARTSPGEPWSWEFQNGFLDPLLRAGAKVVDRAAIVRLTAAKRSGVGSAAAPDEQTIEIQALQGFADVLVEILVGPSGQDLNAMVKDIDTGTILASVNSRTLPGAAPTREYVATSRGFESRERPPELSRVASALALGVMDGLVRAWAH
jgi:hypothetical protein